MSVSTVRSFAHESAPRLPRSTAGAVRWIAATMAMTAVLCVMVFVGLLMVASRLNVDIGPRLAPKLELLDLNPQLIFAGDSRTAFQVDPVLAAEQIGQPSGYAINLAVMGTDPIEFLAVARERPEKFRDADLVLNVSPFQINDGLMREYAISAGTIARLGLLDQIRMFLPRQIASLVWFVQQTFLGFAYHQQAPALDGATRSRLGYELMGGRITVIDSDKSGTGGGAARYIDFLHSEIEPYEGHPYYRDWQPTGFRSGLLRQSLCELRPLVRRLVVVSPPWAPIPDLIASAAWHDLDSQYLAILARMAADCHFELVAIPSVPGLEIEHFFDETHINDVGTPIYTSYLLQRLGYPPGNGGHS